ncbi:PTS sugar transporter [Gilliamella apicola]|jgi:PTS system, fructose subfamily, IIA component|uniref:PTS sugar transporter n=1 Tax=Gilliamella apicola TaxID=1196095 RepID=A0A2V4EUQ6_9GAMM|nr:fructose PTS transporter subunit IIA [Gilliamella apicola]MCT6867960.1 fructose PTS transporter subunit IIA [Gilliamella apicola]PXZ08228.1 PTS sugar transporter [Gilliamella apicola]
MNISANNVIRNDMIFLNKKINSKQEALLFLTEKAQQVGIINTQNEFLNKVLDREAIVSTAVGYQIAMPHGKSTVVQQPFVGFLRTTELFNWSEQDNEMVNMIFLIGVPEENEDNIHLKVISQLSKNLLNDSFREQLENLQNNTQIYSLLSSINKNL